MLRLTLLELDSEFRYVEIGLNIDMSSLEKCFRLALLTIIFQLAILKFAFAKHADLVILIKLTKAESNF